MNTRTNRCTLVAVCLVAFLGLARSGVASDGETPKAMSFDTLPAQLDASSAQLKVLKSPLTFVDSTGVEWEAPSGTLTDGASIPDLFLPFFGDRFDPRFLNAAIVHDAFCQTDNAQLDTYRVRPWRAVHRMFYEAAIAGGTNKRVAQIMLAAIWLQGPRWGDEVTDLNDVDEAVLVEEFEKCRDWINEGDEKSVDSVIEWMDEREPFVRDGVSPDASVGRVK